MKIGVVGPDVSVKRILEIATEADDKLELVPFVYADAHETAELVQRNYHQVKGWIFSGPLPYMLAKEAVGNDNNFAYCSFSGAGLYRSLLEVAYHQKKLAERLSVDMIEPHNLNEVISELGIPCQEIYTFSFSTLFDIQEIIRFHRELWDAGKTDAAITELGAVYQTLKQEGRIPVYWNNATSIEIREALKVVAEKIKASYFKSTQVGLEVIEIGNFDEIAEKAKTPYNLQRLELKIKKELIHLSERVNGSLWEKGQGRYEISSSRGAVERELDLLKDIVWKLSLEVNAPVAVGIGFGETVSSAEINAIRAVSHAKKKKSERIIIINEDGLLVEAVGQKEELSYQVKSHDQELLAKLHEADVSIKTYMRLAATIRRMSWDNFTTSQLAEEWSVTERNIRRIVAGFCKVGLVEYIGEESSAARGRPGRVYKLGTT